MKITWTLRAATTNIIMRITNPTLQLAIDLSVLKGTYSKAPTLYLHMKIMMRL